MSDVIDSLLEQCGLQRPVPLHEDRTLAFPLRPETVSGTTLEVTGMPGGPVVVEITLPAGVVQHLAALAAPDYIKDYDHRERAARRLRQQLGWLRRRAERRRRRKLRRNP